ncbi:MAG: hypothetical protein ACHP9Z_23335 [Streptosporangiales bacterium]
MRAGDTGGLGGFDDEDRPDVSPDVVLTWLLADLALESDRWAGAGQSYGQWGRALVCWAKPGRNLHVVGVSPMAQRLRDLLSVRAAPGWGLHPVPEGQTPLEMLADALNAASGGVRCYNLLRRLGFNTVEELAATPARCLGNLRQSGPKMVAAIQQALAEIGREIPEVSRPARDEEIAERLAHVTGRLASVQQARYREFAGLLARSSLPPAALTKIAESLSAEPVPPADPLACLLLDSAGEPALADWYRRTHTPLPGGQPAS